MEGACPLDLGRADAFLLNASGVVCVLSSSWKKVDTARGSVFTLILALTLWSLNMSFTVLMHWFLCEIVDSCSDETGFVIGETISNWDKF